MTASRASFQPTEEWNSLALESPKMAIINEAQASRPTEELKSLISQLATLHTRLLRTSKELDEVDSGPSTSRTYEQGQAAEAGSRSESTISHMGYIPFQEVGGQEDNQQSRHSPVRFETTLQALPEKGRPMLAKAVQPSIPIWEECAVQQDVSPEAVYMLQGDDPIQQREAEAYDFAFGSPVSLRGVAHSPRQGNIPDQSLADSPELFVASNLAGSRDFCPLSNSEIASSDVNTAQEGIASAESSINGCEKEQGWRKDRTTQCDASQQLVSPQGDSVIAKSSR